MNNYPAGFTQAMHDTLYADGEGCCDACGDRAALIEYERLFGENAVTVHRFCVDCAPKCGCGKPVHPQSEGCCAGCEVQGICEELAEHNQDRPFPMTAAWFSEGAAIEARYHQWRARRAA